MQDAQRQSEVVAVEACRIGIGPSGGGGMHRHAPRAFRKATCKLYALKCFISGDAGIEISACKESSGLHFVLFGSLLLTILYFFMKCH